MTDTPVSWVVTALMTTIATLSSALAFMFKLSESKSSNAITALEKRSEVLETRLEASEKLHRDCLEDRIGLASKIGSLQGQIEVLTRQIEVCKKQIGGCQS